MVIAHSYLPLDFFSVGWTPTIFAVLAVLSLLASIAASVIALRTENHPKPFYIGIVLGVLAMLVMGMSSANSYVALASENLAKNVAAKYSNAVLLEPEDVLWSFITSDGSLDNEVKVVVIIGGEGHLYYLESVSGGEEPLLLPVEHSQSPDPKTLLPLRT